VFLIIFGCAIGMIMAGTVGIAEKFDKYQLTKSMQSTTCNITHVRTLTDTYERCNSTDQLLFLNYTYQNEQLQSIITSENSNYDYVANTSIPCVVSNADKFYVDIHSDVDSLTFVIMLSIGCGGLVVLIGIVAFYYRMKAFGELELENPIAKVMVWMAFMMLFLCCLTALISSWVFVGINGHMWTYTAGKCNVTDIVYQLKAGLSSKSGCYTSKILTETVLILETNSVGTVNNEVNFNTDGRKVGGVYDCYYQQTDVLFERVPYYPMIITGIISLFLTIWSFSELKIATIHYLEVMRSRYARINSQ